MEIRLYDREQTDVTLAGPKHEYHAEQQRFVRSETRFLAACGGRRSGKSRIARDRLMVRAMRAHITHPHVKDYNAIIGAPTRDQVKRLHWRQALLIIPRAIKPYCDISLSEMRIGFPNNAVVRFVGFDKPERAEGESLDDAVLDEIADMKEEAWTLSVRPSLGTKGRPGRCTFIGKPRGRNHWWRIWSEAAEKNGWEQFHWNSEDILEPEEIASLKEDLDPISYDQEVRANFVNFTGRAYYSFFKDVQASKVLQYDPRRSLDFSFDFNVEPGTAGVSQELTWEGRFEFPEVYLAGENVKPFLKGRYTGVIDEVWQPHNSNTLQVAKELIRKWAPIHTGLVNVYGDATGGARRTSAIYGSDWDLIKLEFAKVPNWTVKYHYPRANPPERDRVNSVNARLMATDGHVRMMVCRDKAPHHADDFEGVIVKDGTGVIDKTSKWLTHCSDGIGYKIHKIAPVHSKTVQVKQL